jgi:putative nucleotidyltransferase with HDIG domain
MSVFSDIRDRAYNVKIASKIVVPFIALAVFISFFGGWAAFTFVNSLMDESASSELKQATTATIRTIELFEDEIDIYSTSFAASPNLPKAIAARDAELISTNFKHRMRKEAADFYLVTDKNGTIISEADSPFDSAPTLAETHLMEIASTEQANHHMITTKAGSAIATIAPVKTPNGVAGYVVMGKFINVAYLERIKSIGGHDLAVFDENSLLATTISTIKVSGCQTSDCHASEFKGDYQGKVEKGQLEPKSVTMLGHTYLVDHSVLKVAGHSAGFITVMLPMDSLIALRSEMLTWIILVATVLLLLITGLGYVISKGISNPVRALSVASASVAAGDLSPRVSYPGTRDELGEMASSFNKMTENLDRYTTNLKKRLRELSVLYDVGLTINSAADLDAVLSLILSNAGTAVNADCGSLLLLDPAEGRYVVRGTYNIPDSLRNNVCLDPMTGDPVWITGPHKETVQETGTLTKICLLVKAREGMEAIMVSRDNAEPEVLEKLVATDTVALISVALTVQGQIIGLLNLARNGAKKPFVEDDKNFLATLASQAAIAINNKQLMESLHEAYLATVRSLAEAVDAKDHYTQGHSTRVADFAVKIAKEYSLPDNEIEGIETAAYLHDVGKIGIKDDILSKPGILTPEESDIVRSHPVIGSKILAPINFPWDVVPIIYQHHENYGGGGYPNNLSYDEIHIGARILAVADAYEAMTSDRPYRGALKTAEALNILRKEAGRRYDPRVVELFSKILAKAEKKNGGTKKAKSKGSAAATKSAPKTKPKEP